MGKPMGHRWIRTLLQKIDGPCMMQITSLCGAAVFIMVADHPGR